MNESNLTVTIFSDEYRDLIKTKCNYDILLGLLIDDMELNYSGSELRLSGTNAAKIIEQFAPMAVKLRFDELRGVKSAIAKRRLDDFSEGK